jgi:predicted amidophosphoribosyltransferase
VQHHLRTAAAIASVGGPASAPAARRFCSACGTEAQPEARFCSNCAAPLG